MADSHRRAYVLCYQAGDHYDKVFWRERRCESIASKDVSITLLLGSRSSGDVIGESGARKTEMVIQKLTPFFLSSSVNRVWVDEGYWVRKLRRAPFVVDLCLVLFFAVAVPRVFIHFCGCVMQVSISATLLSSFYFAERFEIKVGRSK